MVPRTERISESITLVRDVCNVYLIRRQEGILAVDFGRGGALGVLAGAAPEWIMHTHFHRDCAIADLRAAAAGTKILVPADERHFFDRAGELWRARLENPGISAYSDRFSPTRDIPVSRTVSGGEEFLWRDLRFEVIDSPGHTRGSVSFLVEIDGKRVAFCGDLIHSPGRMLTYWDLQWNYLSPILSRQPDGRIVEMGMDQGTKPAIRSLVALAEERPDVLCPAHGEVMSEPDAAISLLRTRLEGLYELTLRKTWHESPPVPRQLLPHLYYLGTTSFAIARDDRRILLVDADGGNSEAICDSIRKFGLGKIEVGIATHFHPDHAGFQKLLEIEKFQVWADDHMSGILAYPKQHPLPGAMASALRLDRQLGEMEEFTWGGFRFTSFHFPCHTYYAGGLLAQIDGRRVLFTGDNVDRMADGTLRGSFVCRNRISIREGYLPSARKMVALGPDILVAAHGRGAMYKVDSERLKSYGRWVGGLASALQDFVGQPDYEMGIDPLWIVFRPYHAEVGAGERVAFRVEIKNHLQSPASGRLKVEGPDGVSIKPGEQPFEVDAAGRVDLPVMVVVQDDRPGLNAVVLTASVDFQGLAYGQIAEAIVEIRRGGSR